MSYKMIWGTSFVYNAFKSRTYTSFPVTISCVLIVLVSDVTISCALTVLVHHFLYSDCILVSDVIIFCALIGELMAGLLEC